MMDDKKYQEFLKDLRKILKKYSVRNVVIAGEVGDSYIGAFGIDKENKTFSEIVESLANAARLYQSAREKILGMFENIARRKQV